MRSTLEINERTVFVHIESGVFLLPVFQSGDVEHESIEEVHILTIGSHILEPSLTESHARCTHFVVVLIIVIGIERSIPLVVLFFMLHAVAVLIPSLTPIRSIVTVGTIGSIPLDIGHIDMFEVPCVRIRHGAHDFRFLVDEVLSWFYDHLDRRADIARLCVFCPEIRLARFVTIDDNSIISVIVAESDSLEDESRLVRCRSVLRYKRCRVIGGAIGEEIVGYTLAIEVSILVEHHFTLFDRIEIFIAFRL